MGYVFFVAALVFTLLLIPFSADAARGAAEGLRLFSDSVFPVLFPFFVCSRFLLSRGMIERVKRFRRITICLFSFFIALICGTPSAALICRELLNGKVIGRRQASVLCAIHNLSSPVFIIVSLSSWLPQGSVSIGLFAISHFVPALLLSLVYVLFFSKRIDRASVCFESVPLPRDLSRTVSDAISNAVTAILRVGGTIVFFRVIYSVSIAAGILSFLPLKAGKLMMGILEMTNGLQLVAADPTRLNAAICAGLLSFGGVCIFIQTKMFFEELDTKAYLIAKLVLGIASGIIAWLLYPALSQTAAVFGSLSQELGSAYSYSSSRAAILICGAVSAGFALIVSLLGCKWIRKGI